MVFPRSTPEAQGLDSRGILAFVEATEHDIQSLHSLMLLRNGVLTAAGWWAPYAARYPHMLFSLTKSFTSTAVGFAVAEGRLSLDDHVLSFFPDAAPALVSPNLVAMRVRDLLAMATGHAVDTTPKMASDPDGDWVRGFLACDVEHAPGTFFCYNSGASHMLSAIIQRLTGETLLAYLTPRLFEPLGIVPAHWDTDPRGINTGGWGLMITTEAIARFGQLYLQDGVWQGRRVLPEGWVAQARASHISNGDDPASDWAQGYGFQFWRCRHDAYRGDGAFGQFCVIMPEQQAVLAITAGVEDMQAVLNLAWEHLLPAMHARKLPRNPAAAAALKQKLASLALPPQPGVPDSLIAARLNGKFFGFARNEQGIKNLRFAWQADGGTITIQDARGWQRLICGAGTWQKGYLRFDGPQKRPVAASGAWTAADTYTVKLAFYHTPFCPTMTFQFVGNTVIYQFVANVAFGPKERAVLVGHLAGSTQEPA